MLKKLYFVFLLSLITLNSVSADFQEFEAKSTKDPLYIQTPENIHEYIPVDVKIIINDQATKDKANFVIVDPYNSIPYQTTGGPINKGYMKYTGASSIAFGFTPNGGIGSNSGIDIRFIYAEVVKDGDSGNIHDEDSKFYGYTECRNQNNELLCNGQESCNVCFKYVSSIYKDYITNKSDNAIKFPAEIDEINISASSSHGSSIKEITPNSETTWSYREHIKFNVEVFEAEAPLRDTIDEFKSFVSDYQEEKVPSPIGGESAYLYFKDQKIHNGSEQITLQYEMYSDMVPAGSGILNARGTIGTLVTDEEKASIKAKLKADFLGVVGSFKLSPGEVTKSDTELMHNYSLYDREEIVVEEIEEKQIVYGSITDVFDNALPYMEISIFIGDKTLKGVTDKTGDFSISLEGIKIGEEDLDAELNATFKYKRDDKIYYTLHFLGANNRYKGAIVGKKFKIQKGVDAEVRFKIEADANDPSRTTNIGFTRDINPSGVIYYHMHEALDFYLRKLKLTIDHKLPVSVWIGNNRNNTLYNPNNSDILIASSNASNSSSNRPKNREFHEFSHHLMFDIYGKRPSDRSLPGTQNHAGFYNPGTADSYIEGFAEFMAMVIADELGQDKAYEYAGFGSFEKNYRPWDRNGKFEEVAVASLLRDLYDNNNEPGDELYYSIETIWEVLKVERKDFYEYYKAFKAAKPLDADKIDKLFIEHGFFKDTRVGNKKYDDGEPWRRIDQDADTWEYIDLSAEKSKIKHEKGLKIGPATNYERPNRSSMVELPNSYIKVDNNEVDFYNIKVSDSSDGQEDYEYTVEIADGKVYIQPLPDNVEAIITVTPKTKDYKVDASYTIKNQELLGKLSDRNLDKGFFDEHKFDLEATGLKVDEHYEMYNDTPPSTQYKGDLDGEIEIKIDKSSSDNKDGFPFIKLLLLIIACIYGYFYYKSEKVRKNTATVLAKIKEYLIISWKWFLAHGVPFLKKVGLLIWKYIKILIKKIKDRKKESNTKEKEIVEKNKKQEEVGK